MRYIIFLTGMFFFLGNHVKAQFATVNESSEAINLAPFIYYLIDDTESLNLQDVVSIPFDSLKKNKAVRPIFGFNSKPHWLKIELKNPDSVAIPRSILVGNSMIHHIDFYHVVNDSVILEKRTGAQVQVSKRDYQLDEIFVDVSILPGVNTFVIRYQTESALAPELFLYKPNQVYSSYFEEIPYFAFLIGILIFSVLYNLVIAYVVKDNNYLIFVLTQFLYMIVVLALSGLGQTYIWDSFTYYTGEIHRFSLYFGSAWSMIFSIRFLETKIGTPKLHVFFSWMAGVLFVLSGITLLGFYEQFSAIGTLILMIVIIFTFVASIIRYRQGYKPARFFLLAKTLLLFAVFINFLTSLQLIPYVTLLVKSHFIAGGLEAILLSFALADRIKIITYEAEKAKNAQLQEKIRAEQAEYRAKTAELQAHAAEIQAKAVEAENQRKTEELEQARKMQLAMLPKLPPFMDSFDVSMYMKTATEVGGDYYDFFPQQDDSLMIAFGDASGHGLTAGVMVTITKTALTFMPTDSLPLLMKLLNKGIYEIRPNRMNMAMRLLHVKQDELVMSTAAMPDVVIYHANSNTCELITQPGLPLGSVRSADFDEIHLPQLQQNDILVMVSDGIIEHKNEQEEEFGYERLQQTIIVNAAKNGDELIDALLKEIDSFASLDTIEDDLSFLVMKKK